MKKRASIKGGAQGLIAILQSWLIQHARACVFSFGQIYGNPVGSILTMAVIGVSLSLPAGLYLLLDNAGRVTANWGGSMQITLFLDPGLSNQEITALAETLRRHEDIDNIRLIDADAALAEYRQYSGFSDALTALDTNPLPAVILLNPKRDTLTTDKGKQLLDYLQGLDAVETAQFDRQWANRLFAFIEIFQRVIFVLSTLLAFAVLLIIGNTIRLAIYNRRAEIEITRLFGATDAFIQRPFLYSGFIHGIGGSIMAWALLLISIKLLEQPVIKLSGLYASDFQLFNLGTVEVLILITIGGLLGLVGSWLAVQRNFKAIGLS
jgi:cell division transport system permease protein